MINNPTLPYCGITIILDKPSRHDGKMLISGFAGDYFWRCLHPFLRQQVVVKTLDDSTTLRDGTKSILLLGNDSIGHVVSTSDTYKSLMQYRGSPFVKDKLLYLPSFAPQDAYDRKAYDGDDSDDEEQHETASEKDFQRTRRVNWRFWLKADCNKLTRLHRYGIVTREHPKVTYYPTFTEFREAFRDSNGPICFDIETNQHQQITCFGLGDNRQYYVIPFIRYDNTLAYDKTILGKFLCRIAELFSSHRIIGHNIAGFDLLVLALNYKLCLPHDIYDTMIAHHRCYPELEKSLGHCISLYLDEVYHKDEGIFAPRNQSQEQQLWNYNAKDVIRTYQIYEQLQQRIKRDQGLTASVIQANESIRVYSTATIQGAKLDIGEFKNQFEYNNERVDLLRTLLKKVARLNINANSPIQVSNYLYDLLGYKKPDKDATNKKQLYKLYAKTGIPSIRIILAIRNTRKRVSDLQFKIYKDTRFTTLWKITGTDTFRLASSALFHWNKSNPGFGSNFQNWNKKRRKMLVADDCYLVQIDQAGAEALIVAYLTRHGNFRELFLNNVKPHVFMALHLVPEYWQEKLHENILPYLQTPIAKLHSLPRWKELAKLIADSDNSADPAKRYYYIGKTVIHAANYDMKAPTMQMQALDKSEGELRLTLDFCNKALDIHRKRLFAEIPEWHVDIQNQLRFKNRTLINLFGYPRIFNGHLDETTFRKAYAFIPQSTVGIITNLAATEIQKRIDSGELRCVDVLNNCHDSLLLQIHDSYERTVEIAKDLQQHFNRKLISPRGEIFYMKSSASVGKNWAPFSESNQDGLKEI